GETGLPPNPYPAPLSNVPWSVTLPPRIYGIVAKNPSYQTKRRMELVELYESSSITIEMIEAPAAAPAPASLPRGIEEAPPGAYDLERSESALAASSGGPVADSEANILRSRGPAWRPRALVDPRPNQIACPDRLAQLEIAHESGLVLASGRGRVSLPSNSKAGIYRA